ncbi:MAG: tetratricopeptide repeat protein [Verrucomicrobiaceae bacterium]|nr:tetratricopeptide repeat protein [Verrucomicrobiaceae bacterium]
MSLDLSSGPVQFDLDRARRFRPGPITLGALVFFVLLVTWLVLGTSTVHTVKTWMARREAGAALEAVRAEHWGAAVRSIIEARKLAPEDPEVLRATISFLKETGSDPSALSQMLRMLDGKEQLRVEDQLLWADSLLSSGDAAGARKIYEKTAPESRDSPESLQVSAKLASAEGRSDEAREITRRITQVAPSSPESRLALAMEDRSSPGGLKKDSARATLWEIARLKTRIALEAITHLTIDPDLTLAETDELLTINEEHPHRSLPVRLGILSARMRLQPAQRENILSEEVARFQREGGGLLEDIARWLAFEKQHARILKLVPESLATRSREIYPIVAHSLASEGRWQELKTMLVSSRPPVSKIRADIWLAEAESHLQGGIDEARRLLEVCVESSRLEKDISNLIASSTLAEKLGLFDLALNACREIATLRPEAAVEALQRARDHAVFLKDTRALLSLARQLQQLRPASTIFADQLTYFRLLLGEEMEKVDLAALKRADMLSPTGQAVRIPISLLEALAAYRFSDHEALSKHIKRLPSVPDMSAGHRAVLAGMLATVGDTARAFQIAEKVPAALLLDEERSFLKLAQ